MGYTATIMLEINPKELPGDWVEGFALDYHTLSAV